MRVTACLLALCFVPALANAQPATVCKDAPPPPEPWTSWMQSGSAIAGAEPISAPRLILGKPVVATLRPVAQIQFAAAPAKIDAKSHGGLFTLAVKAPARIGVALSGPAWADVVIGSTSQPVVDHGYGLECSGIRKIVWFDLEPGLHIVQIANAPTREMRIMAADAIANRPLPRADGNEAF
ncbi:MULTISPECIES: hypothetical protein [Sphingobium]|uniref:Uncharacterized protein n=1 Tax=Sphingobium tyrosinilyticum TaxID=2715436 RepID=A0ABV9F423_9SPHN|nr:hypothetical protein [Sphingobium sp. EP60837]ANI76541.1 hypothetical protein EP837_00085 [Sphingobium sp. EP60837]